MGWWSDIRDSAFTPSVGAAIGNALGQTWAYNYNQRGIDKATDAIKKYEAEKLRQMTEGYTDEAKKKYAAAYGANDYIGLTPQQGLLNAKKQWWQAQNDAQYLLNNGYDENSDDVKKFRAIQQDAHEMADNFRKLGGAKGIDLTNVDNSVNSLESAKAAVEANASPYYKFGDYQMPKDALSIGYKKPPTKAEIDQAALKVGSLQLTPTPAEVQNVYANGNATPNDVAPQNAQNMQAVANEMAGAQPQAQPQPQANQPVPQNNTQAPQSPYNFSVEEIRKAGEAIKNNPSTITMQDVYDTFGNGIDKKIEDEINQQAKAALALEQKSPDYRENLRRDLIKQGLPAGQVEAALQKIDMREKEQQKKQAQAAVVASLKNNPQAAALINYAMSSGANVGDVISAFAKSGSNYDMYTLDAGGQKYAIRYDKNGRGPGSMQAFNVSPSPNNVIAAHTAITRTAMDNETQKQVADIKGRYGLAGKSISGLGNSGNSGGGSNSTGLAKSEKSTLNKAKSLWNEIRYAGGNLKDTDLTSQLAEFANSDEVKRADDDIQDAVNYYALAANFLYYKSQGYEGDENNSSGEEMARTCRQIANNMPEEWRNELLGGYDFSGWKNTTEDD